MFRKRLGFEQKAKTTISKGEGVRGSASVTRKDKD
jgi:hypothetical protein